MKQKCIWGKTRILVSIIGDRTKTMNNNILDQYGYYEILQNNTQRFYLNCWIVGEFRGR